MYTNICTNMRNYENTQNNLTTVMINDNFYDIKAIHPELCINIIQLQILRLPSISFKP